MGGIGLKQVKIPTKLKQTLGNDMKSTFQTLALACALTTPAMAADNVGAPGALRPFVGIGYSSGGDTIMPVQITVTNSAGTQYREDISGGAGIEGRAGLWFRPQGSAFSVRGSLGVHNDQANGINNDQSFFRRYPIELQAIWHQSPQLSLGLGARKATRAVLGVNNATLRLNDGSTVSNVTFRQKYTSSVGVVLEGEWAITPGWGLSLRYVRERFKTQDEAPETVNGDHVGLATQWYFN